MTRFSLCDAISVAVVLTVALSVSNPLYAASASGSPSCDAEVMAPNGVDEGSDAGSPLGHEFSGSKVYALLTRLPGMSMTEFSEHWRDPHGTLTKRLPYFKRYVQNHSLSPTEDVAGFEAIAYDGIPSVWVEHEDDLQKAFEDPRYAELDADVDKLYQRSKTVWIQGTEYTWCRTPALASRETVKVMLFLNREDGSNFDGNLAKFLKTLSSTVPSAVEISTVIPADKEQAAYDAVVEILFKSIAAYREAWQDNGATIRDAAMEFVDMNDSGVFLARGEVVVPEEGSR